MIKSADPQMWYADMVGRKFFAWRNPNAQGALFVHQNIYVLEHDCNIIPNGKNEEEGTVFN